jgi:hypothetical protein
MSDALAQVFAEILKEAKTNRSFGERIDRALGLKKAEPVGPAPSKRRNRRAKAALDPYAEWASGEALLRDKLSKLDVNQLKDIVSEHAMDPSRLALKWQSQERLQDLIVHTVRARVEKGDVFRSHGAES